MDGLGQTGSDRSGDHADDGVLNGHSAPWAKETWSSAGAALEPSFEPLSSWNGAAPDRRGIEALAGGDTVDDSLTSTLVQPRFTPYAAATSEDPYADELAQRSAEFARHAALDDPTPAQGIPALTAPPVAWTPPPPVPAEFTAPLPESPPEPDDFDPPLAAQLTLGQRFGMAFSDPAEAAAAAAAADRSADQGPYSALNDFDDSGREAPGLRRPFHDAFSSPAPETPTPHRSYNGSVAEGPGRRRAIEEPEVVEEAVLDTDPAEAEVEADADLPQRIPAEPDVPEHDPTADNAPFEDKAQLSRIMSQLQREDVPEEQRPDGFDVQAVLAAVKAVAGVREATMRTTVTGAHHLRLELAEGADPATISRMVARMLQEQMGLNAALTGGAPGQAPVIPGQGEGPASPAPVVLPGPRTGLGAAPPPAVDKSSDNWPDPVPLPSLHDRHPPVEPIAREPRRRHPVSVPRRQTSELRPSERAAATWKAAIDSDQPAGSDPPPLPNDRDQGPRAIIEHVQTSTFGLDAMVEVRLNTGSRVASGVASGPAVDGYVLRLCAAATAVAIDDLLKEGTTTGEGGRCFVEHAAIVPMGTCDVAVVVVLLVCGGWVEQLAGSALVSGDPRRAVVRATLGAVNRRLAALLP